ncbi:hypothetical protein [Primorskyibacter flagellatus]|nr:hypothetical protein [Primorskyibacter flagellatus]
MTWDDAAKAAGLSPAGVYKARLRDEVKARLLEIQSEYVQEVEALKAPHKARALEVGRELMDTAKSEAVRARMVEFFAGERSGPTVNVQINNNNSGPRGYEYARPGQEVVTLRPARRDGQSPASDVQDAEIVDD